MSRRQFVILSRNPAAQDGTMVPLGTRAEVLAGLAHCNTGPDSPNGDVLYGPGLELHLAPGDGPVTQMLMTVSDDDVAWLIIMRIAKEFGWKILDPESGREFQL